MVIKIIRWLDRIIDGTLIIGLMLCLAIAAMGLYSSYVLIQKADAVNYKQYKKKKIDFEALMKLNPSVIGWLEVEGTHISYPVVQGKTNLEYINKTVEGEYSLSGSIFLDYRNSPTLQDSYSVIYGHHMAGDVMFGELPKFCQKTFFNKHQRALLHLKDKVISINLFACLKIDAFDETLFNPTIHNNQNQAILSNYIKEKAIQYRAPSKKTDQTGILALSTCEDTSTNGRILVVGEFGNH
ncbi:class B sortase [Streptococcus castoreus]|uniref:class B sortase n=1 Tax=Streptococcus castoreus TaxID=254786 RepID=UPI0004288849|nr:class B sortase [Streptococcus castoreus]